MMDLIVKKAVVKECPWEKSPWAFDKNQRFYTNDIRDTDSVLLLCDNDIVLAYLAYRVWTEEHVVEIPYVHTRLGSQNKGYAKLLMNKVCEEYSSQYEVNAYATSCIAENLLGKCGFKRLGTEKESKWVRIKTPK